MQPSLTFDGAWSLGTSQRGQFWVSEDQKQFPSPNTYTLSFRNKPKAREPKFAQGPRQDLADKRGFPGPGTYDHLQKKGYQYDKIKMKFPINQKLDNFVPGPPTYDPNYRAQKPSSLYFSMSYKHPKEIINDVPAPNSYPTEEGMNFIQQRTQQKWMRKTNTSGFGTSPQRSVFNSTKRLDVKKKLISNLGNPGPGEYFDNQSKSTTGYNWSFPKGKRPPLNIENDLPGPSEFNPKFPMHSKSNGFSMGVKLDKGMKMYETCSPGPGTYPNLNLISKKGIIIGTSSNHGGIIDERQAFLTPGPNHYDQKILQLKESHLKSHSIGLADRPDLNIAAQQNVPGPGTYTSNKNSLGGPKWSFKGRIKTKKDQFVPGPAQYTIQSTDDGKATGFGKMLRPALYNSENPNIGPNSYQQNQSLNNNAGSKYSMSGASRFSRNKKSYEPGPGSYDIPGTIGRIPDYLLLNKKKNSGLLDF